VVVEGTKACFGLRLQPSEWNDASIAGIMSWRWTMSADLGPKFQHVRIPVAVIWFEDARADEV
jgi:hypothetical protein